MPDDEWRSREEIDKHEWVPAGELVGENNTESAIPGESQSAGTGTSATASTRDQNADDLSDEDQEGEGKPLDEELPSKTDQNSDDLVDEVEGGTYREVQKGAAGSQNNDDLGDDGDKLLENVTDIGDPPNRQGSYRQEEGKYYSIPDALDSNADDLFLVKDDDGGMWEVSTESNAIVKDDDLNMWRVPELEGRGSTLEPEEPNFTVSPSTVGTTTSQGPLTVISDLSPPGNLSCKNRCGDKPPGSCW